MGKSITKNHGQLVRMREKRYKWLQEIRRQYLYKQGSNPLSVELKWPMPLYSIKLESSKTYKMKPKSIALTLTSSYSTQDLLKYDTKENSHVNLEELETFSRNRLKQYIKEKLDQLEIKLSRFGTDQCINNSISLIHSIFKGYSLNGRGRTYVTYKDKTADWMDILHSAMRSNIPKSVIQQTYQRLKARFPETNEHSAAMETTVVDYLNKKEVEDIDSYLSSSIFNHTTPLEDFLMEKLSNVENDIYKNEPAYMDITKLNIPDTKRLADIVDIIYTNKKD